MARRPFYAMSPSAVSPAVRSWLAGCLCVSLFCPADLLAANGQPAVKGTGRSSAAPLTKEQRTLHALDRFSFGPVPGQVAAGEKRRKGVRDDMPQSVLDEDVKDSTEVAKLEKERHPQFAQSSSGE